MKKPMLGWILVLVIVVIAAAFFIRKGDSNSSVPGKYDDFARCLTDSGVKEYGAFWCPHCQNQEKMFGPSWKYVTYIECSPPDRSGQLPVCSKAGITGYPTWEFKDGSRKSGEQTFADLSLYSGCALP